MEKSSQCVISVECTSSFFLNPMKMMKVANYNTFQGQECQSCINKNVPKLILYCVHNKWSLLILQNPCTSSRQQLSTRSCLSVGIQYGCSTAKLHIIGHDTKCSIDWALKGKSTNLGRATASSFLTSGKAIAAHSRHCTTHQVRSGRWCNTV